MGLRLRLVRFLTRDPASPACATPISITPMRRPKLISFLVFFCTHCTQGQGAGCVSVARLLYPAKFERERAHSHVQGTRLDLAVRLSLQPPSARGLA